MTLMFGNTPVPWTVSWSSEEGMFIAPCPHFARRPAISQIASPGEGKPQFGKPHMNRQRTAIAECRCDLCGKSLKLSAKISLSHARPQMHGAEGWAILQVEPLLHPKCAHTCISWCPSLKRDVENGTIVVRHVTRWRPQCAVMDETFTETQTGQRVKALGHAKVELLRWTDRDPDWLADRVSRSEGGQG